MVNLTESELILVTGIGPCVRVCILATYIDVGGSVLTGLDYSIGLGS